MAASPRGTLDPRCCGDPHPRGRSSAGHILTLPVGVDGGATGPHVVRMRRSIRIANPLVPAAERSRGPAFAITEFATDSPLEGDGFELPVPRQINNALRHGGRDRPSPVDGCEVTHSGRRSRPAVG